MPFLALRLCWMVLAGVLAGAVPATPAAAQAAHGAAHGTPHVHPDVVFMQGMLPHHAQALDMTALVADRTQRREIHLIAERIDVSQRDEMAWMTRWLRAQGAEPPDAHAHHGAGHALMPGMLTPAEMAQLAAATGPAFDRLFLQLMIRHHEGALLMVDSLLADGGGQDSEVYRLASDIEADQQAEIQRMRRLLDVPPLPSLHRP